MFIRARWFECITEENGKYKNRSPWWAISGKKKVFSF
jgi:hypothetical protein